MRDGECSWEAIAAAASQSTWRTAFCSSVCVPTVVALNSWSASHSLTSALGYRVPLVYTDNGDAQVLCWDRESLPEVEATPKPREDLAVLGDTGFSYGVFDKGDTDDTGHPKIRIETGELLRWSESLDDEAVKVLRVELRGDAAF